MSKPEIILGLTGMICSGKGEASAYLVSHHGFKSSSFSDRIREELSKRGEEITRDSLQRVGGEMRQEFGPEVLAKRTLEHVLEQGGGRAVVDTIRSVEEANFLKQNPNFYLVHVDAEDKVRFERIKSRNRENDPKTWEDFQKAQERDDKAEGRSMRECFKLADFTILNNGKPEDMYEELDKLLQKLDES